MKAIIALCLVGLSLTYTPLSNCDKGTITMYDTAESDSVACKPGTSVASGFYRAAASEQFFLKSSQCGICYELTGEIGTALIQVTDLCPAEGNEEHCAGSNTHFDLSTKAFPKLCNTINGVCPITYRMVSCDVTGNIKVFVEAANGYYMQFYVRNYKVGLKSVTVKLNGVDTQLTRESANFFRYNGKLPTSVEITLTSISGASVKGKFTPSNGEHDLGVQFGVPSDVLFNPKTLTKDSSTTKNCCPNPINTAIYDNALEKPWAIRGGNPTYCSTKTSNCDIKSSLSLWSTLQITADNHDIDINAFSGISLEIKGSTSGKFEYASIGSSTRKQMSITTSFKKVILNFADMGISGSYFHGFELQNVNQGVSGNFVYTIRNVYLVKKEDKCPDIDPSDPEPVPDDPDEPEPVPDDPDEPEPSPLPEPTQVLYLYENSLYDNGWPDKFDISTNSGSTTYCQGSQSCNIETTLDLWGSFMIASWGKEFTGFSSVSFDIYVKSGSATLGIWGVGKTSAQKIDFSVTTTKKTVTFKLADLQLTGFQGIEIQLRSGSSNTLVINNVRIN